ncbi:MAG: hypothetical protein IJM37_07330 [Lachnospiraceae bacterium]|nr:hypothetical protein [Lachnospiraceae bacterium]
MKIPLPFPKCKKCKKESPQAYHKDCGGVLLIETNNDYVSCKRCKESWDIWDSKYYCSCGNVFSAKSVKNTLIEVLAYCKVCAEELEAQRYAKETRKRIADDSLRGFLNAFLEKIGYGLGVAVETIINTVISYFLK